ncbi:GDP-mannose-dependent alpha-mannosyltransferase [Tepidimonas fonticaldi]|uniref:GDP-mannose-dependent alpha-mannosyltransferase n=2 Tax=Tepidimonas fonticaldi TaxID=1101373 RepID=A0A554XQS4_9BURK|nr:GDP-mannose-dependent alpha-mannosyltransferase [Tepidimonas fonticaldi]
MIESFPPRRALLRVSVVTETFPPEVNGVATTVERLVRGLQLRDHDVQVVRPRQAADAWDRDGSRLGLEQVLTRGLPIPRYPQLRMGLPAQRALQALWMRRRPDIVHIATEGPLGWSALRTARKLQLPVSTDFRTNFDAYSEHYGVGWLRRSVQAYLRRFHNLADCTLVPTDGLRQQLRAAGFERLIVVQRGVDVDRFTPALRNPALRAVWGVQPGERVLLYVGRLAPEKNLELLAAAYDAMRAVQPGWRLVVVGDGPQRAWLAQRCPQAVLLGALAGEALAQAYANGDLLAFPSLTETFGNVTLEALASGLPVLAFDYAAAAEVVRHGDSGLLAPVGDADAYLQLARTVAGDDALLQRLRAGAVHAVQHLGWGRIVEQVESIWLRLLAAHAAGPAVVKSSPWWDGLPATGA